MQDITKIAEQLNSRVAQLNNERSRQLGMQESAKKQYDNAIKAYETKYGIKLSEANLQEEYNKVYAEVKGKVTVLQGTIESIERGDYKNVEKPADIDLEPNVAPIMPEQKAKVKVAEPTPVVSPVVEPAPIINPAPVVNPINLGEATPVVEPTPVVNPISFGENLGIVPEEAPVVKPAPIINPAPIISDDEDRPFWETAAPVQPKVEQPQAAPQVEVPPTINFGGVAPTQAPAFGGTPLSFEVENSFDGEDEDFDSDYEVKVPDNIGATPTQAVPPVVEEEEEEEEVISPEGWGTPKSADDINKNFKDILGQSGIKFGE